MVLTLFFGLFRSIGPCTRIYTASTSFLVNWINQSGKPPLSTFHFHSPLINLQTLAPPSRNLLPHALLNPCNSAYASIHHLPPPLLVFNPSFIAHQLNYIREGTYSRINHCHTRARIQDLESLFPIRDPPRCEDNFPLLGGEWL